MMKKSKIFLLPVVTVLSLASCDDSVTHSGVTSEQAALDKRLGEIGIGDGFRTGLDADDGLYGPYSSEQTELVALSLENNSSITNLEYAEELYGVAMRLPKGSYVRKILLIESEHRLEIAVRNSIKKNFVQGFFAQHNQDKKNQHYKYEVDVLQMYSGLHEQILAAQAEG